MYKFIKNLFNKHQLEAPMPSVEVEGPRTFSRHPLTITVHYAHGGIILNSRQYDKKLQDYDNINYVVHDDEDISKTVEKIIFMNSLKQ